MTVSTKTLIIHRVKKDTDESSRHVVQIDSDQTILEALNANKISIHQECGGSGTCLTCRFINLSDENSLTLRNEIESEMANLRGFSSRERLACQTSVKEDSEIEITFEEI
jgi:ferredoxin